MARSSRGRLEIIMAGRPMRARMTTLFYNCEHCFCAPCNISVTSRREVEEGFWSLCGGWRARRGEGGFSLALPALRDRWRRRERAAAIKLIMLWTLLLLYGQKTCPRSPANQVLISLKSSFHPSDWSSAWIGIHFAQSSMRSMAGSSSSDGTIKKRASQTLYVIDRYASGGEH